MTDLSEPTNSDILDAIEMMRDGLWLAATELRDGTDTRPHVSVAAEIVESASDHHWFRDDATRRGLLDATRYTVREAITTWRDLGEIMTCDREIICRDDATAEQVEAFDDALSLAIATVDRVANDVCAAMATRTRRIICGVGA